MKKAILTLLALILVSGIYSCNEQSSTIGHDSDSGIEAVSFNYDSDEFLVDNIESNVTDATLENDMVLYPDEYACGDDKDKDKNDKDRGDKGDPDRRNLKKIF